MKFSVAAVAAFGAALTAAAPQSEEFPFPKNDNVEITEFTIRRGPDNAVKSASFSANGNEVQGLTCSAENPTLGVHLNCDQDPWYRFILYSGNTAVQQIYFMHIYNPGGSGFFSPGVGGWLDVPISCEAEGEDQVCTQTNAATVHIRNQGQ